MNVSGVVRALEVAGQDITIRRLTGTNRVPFEVKCRASVQVGAASVLINGVQQTADRILVTSREMANKRWPGPPRHGDEVVYSDDRVTSVQGRSQVYNIGDDQVYVFHTRGG